MLAALLSVIVARGSQSSRDLASFLMVPFLLFGLFYFEYVIVEKLVKCELDLRFGYLQAAGCWAITLFAALAVAFAKPAGTIELNALLVMGVFGEIVFVGNVVWTYMQQAGRSRQQQPAFAGHTNRTTSKSAGKSGWPKSPGAVFGIAAAFFLVLGSVLVAVRPFGSHLPFSWNGRVSQIPAGYLWISTALPFALFALIYVAAELLGKRAFEIQSTKIHFFCTVLVVIEGIREYVSWASSWANPNVLNNPITAGQFSGAFALALLVAISFGWNVWTSRRVSYRDR